MNNLNLKNWAEFLICLLVVSLPFHSGANDLYVAQSVTGGGSGAGASDCVALTSLNSWTNISAGDTVHLVGTFTNTLSIGGSGTAGNPITILFEPDARFVRPAWGTPAPASDDFTADPIVQGSGFIMSYVIIDGGVNGLIADTSTSGNGQPYTNNCTAVHLANCGAGVEVRNLTITNMVWRQAGQATDTAGGSGIYMIGTMTNCSIHNCTVDQAGNAFLLYYLSGISRGLQIYSNSATHISWGCGIAAQQTPSACYDSAIWANTFDHFETFQGNAGNHQDGIICYTTMAGQTNFNLQIYRNRIGPHIVSDTTGTAAIFINDTQGAGSFKHPLIHNNVLSLQSGNTWMDGFIYTQAEGALIANNTFVAGGNCIAYFKGDGTNHNTASFINNLTYGVGTVHQQSEGSPVGYQTLNITNSDYNVGYAALYWWNPGSFTWGGSTSYRDHVTYPQFTGFDDHSTTNQPLLNVSYQPLTNDVVAVGKGTDLSAYFTTDFTGATRFGAWTIGAFQTTSTRKQILPPTITTVVPNLVKP